MANNIIKRVWNQGSMTPIEDLQGSAFTNENGGHTFQISGVDSNGEALALSGTVAASFLRPDQTTVGISGSVSGGVASVTLSEECYGIPGRFGLVIFLTSDGKKTAIYSCVGNVARSSTDAVAPGVVADVVDLINEIETAVGTIPASYSALMADIAPTYSSSALYAVGDYAWYEGDLKRCIVPITVGETYTPAHWTSAVVGDDVCALKSAISKEFSTTQSYNIGDYVWYEGALYRFTDNHSSGSWVGTDAIEVTVMNEMAHAGEQYGSITINKNETYEFDDDIEAQIAPCEWIKEGSKVGNDFVNLARDGSTIPFTVNVNGYTQMAAYIFPDAVASAYNLGDGELFVGFYIDITGSVTLSIPGSNPIINSSGNNISEITQSGWYYGKSGALTGETATVNKFYLAGSAGNTGTAEITYVYCQSSTWIATNYQTWNNTTEKFMQLFPELNIEPGEDYIAPIIGSATASVTINGITTNYDDSDRSIPIESGAVVAVTKGTLTLYIIGGYDVNKIYRICDRRYKKIEDWSNIKWAVVGDSLTDTTINASKKYQQIIHAKTGIQIQSLGLGGTGYTAGYDNNATFRDRILTIDEDTDIVTIFGSVNDWKNNPFNSLCPDIGTASDVYDTNKTVIQNTFCANLNHTFDALFDRVPTAQVIVFSSMPYYGVNENYHKAARDAVKDVCAYRHIPYVDMFETGYWRIIDYVQYAVAYTYEGQQGGWESISDYPAAFGHPNNDAHQKIIAPKFYEELKRWII